ncbi:hypothetical protein D3C78_1368350 [compost metagenome]
MTIVADDSSFFALGLLGNLRLNFFEFVLGNLMIPVQIKISFVYKTHQDLEVIDRLVTFFLLIEAVENRVLVGH